MISNEIFLVDIPGIQIMNDRNMKDFAVLNDNNYDGMEEKGGYPAKK